MKNSKKDSDLEKGYIHVYTGNGKGKTTAAFGLALRAMMAGKKVFVGQFVKSMKYNETKIEGILPDMIHIEQLGSGCFLQKDPSEEDVRLAREGLARCAGFITDDDRYDVVILDEISIALSYGLISVGDVLDVLKKRRPEKEIILTGRYMPDEIIAAGDLVTEMKEIRHYYSKGVLSRDGIDR